MSSSRVLVAIRLVSISLRFDVNCFDIYLIQAGRMTPADLAELVRSFRSKSPALYTLWRKEVLHDDGSEIGIEKKSKHA